MLCKSRSFKDVVLTKRKIRAKILLRLNSQKEEDQEKKSKIIKEKLFRQSAFKKAKRIMFYISLDGEVDTASMIQEAQKLGKIIAVPVCKRNSIMLRPAILKLGARL